MPEIDGGGAGGIAGVAVSKNSGAIVGTRPELNFIEGNNVEMTIADDAINDEIDITINGNVSVSKNSGAVVGSRTVLNLIEGANVTLTIADDAPGDEVDVTIAAAGAAAGNQDIFYEAPDPDDYKGRYATMLMLDLQSTLIRQTFYLPNNYDTDWGVSVIVIPDGTGNLRWGCNTNFGQVCAGEQYDIHSDTIALGESAVTNGEIECLDITAALTGAVAGDVVGIEVTRDGAHANDTVGASVHYVGIVLTVAVQ